MKFLDSSINGLKVTVGTKKCDARTDAPTLQYAPPTVQSLGIIMLCYSFHLKVKKVKLFSVPKIETFKIEENILKFGSTLLLHCLYHTLVLSLVCQSPSLGI